MGARYSSAGGAKPFFEMEMEKDECSQQHQRKWRDQKGNPRHWQAVEDY